MVDYGPRIAGPGAREKVVWRYIGLNYVQFSKMKLQCVDVKE